MKFAFNYNNDSLSAIFTDDMTPSKGGCYLVNINGDFKKTKMVKKGRWRQLRDDGGSLMWNDGSLLVPKMGFEVDGEVKIGINQFLELWSLEDIIEYKYASLLSQVDDYNALYYNELCDESSLNVEGNLHLGKKFCSGNGIIKIDLPLKNNKIYFDCECPDGLPNIEISLNGSKWTKIDEVPFIHNFSKTKSTGIYLRIKDDRKYLSSFYLCVNIDNFTLDRSIGSGLIKLSEIKKILS